MRVCSGFTLVELMVVLVLIGILTAMIIPEMKGTFEDALLRSTARKLVRASSLAYSQAVTASQQHRLRIDVADGRYSLERFAPEDAAGFIPVREVPGAEGELDNRISIEIRGSSDPSSAELFQETSGEFDSEPSSSGRAEGLMFYPDGTAAPAEIMLRDRAGFGLALRVNPVTARIRIVELDRELSP